MKALTYLIVSACVFLFGSNTSAQSGPSLYFANPVLESGIAGADGVVYRFSNVATGVDALVSINGRSDILVNMLNIDMTGSGFDAALQPQVGYNNGTAPGPADWWMEFEVRFVETGTSNPVTLIEYNVSGVDIDGNGQYINEYLAFYRMETYSLEVNSGLALSGITETVDDSTYNIGLRFDGPTGNFANIDTAATTVMVTNRYANTDRFTFRTGGRSSAASGASDRMYSLYFREFNYNSPHQIALALQPKKLLREKISPAASVYPNPFAGKLDIVIPDVYSRSDLYIQVLDMSGRHIYQTRVNDKKSRYTLFLSQLKKGIYAVRITGDNYTNTQLVSKL